MGRIGQIPWNKNKKGWTHGTRAGFQKGNNLGHFHHVPKGTHNSPLTEFKKGHKFDRGEKGINNLKREVRNRDNNTCQMCGFHDEDIMVVDHKIPKAIRPDLSKALENLQTLCPNCHARKSLQERRSKLYGRWKLR